MLMVFCLEEPMRCDELEIFQKEIKKNVIWEDLMLESTNKASLESVKLHSNLH